MVIARDRGPGIPDVQQTAIRDDSGMNWEGLACVAWPGWWTSARSSREPAQARPSRSRSGSRLTADPLAALSYLLPPTSYLLPPTSYQHTSKELQPDPDRRSQRPM